MAAVGLASPRRRGGPPMPSGRRSVDRWQYQDATGPDDPHAEAWAAALRAALPARSEQMRADADETVRRFATAGIVAPAGGLARADARPMR